MAPASLPSRRARRRQLRAGPGFFTTLAVVVGWFAIDLSWRHSPWGVALASLTTVLAIVAFWRGRELARRRREQLSGALRAADRRNRELERLRHLEASLLGGTDVAVLQREVAEAAAELLQADFGLVALLVEEGRFQRVVAATGEARAVVGQLVPVDRSLIGWAALQDQPVLTSDLAKDPRSYQMPELGQMRSAAIVPLRSAGVVIGTMSVAGRAQGTRFTADDLQLLQTLGDQVVVALDRAQMLEETRRTSDALAAKNRELLQATELRDKFLANMSHELRTPLNAIIGFSELLQTGDVGEINDAQRDFLESVIRNGKHLLGLINSILDLSKIDAGRMALVLEPTELRAVILGVITDTASLRAAKRQECAVELDDADPLAVTADGVRVRQILINLLSNASKFTPEGGRISVSAIRTRAPLPLPGQRTGEAPRLLPRDAVWISVSDTGIGIRQEDMPKLFQEFSQVDSEFSRQQQGTGLGLALSKRFVEMHGGTIGVESVPGVGSTFWFILPVEGPVRRAPA